jgi:hypothetical protein
VKEEVSFGEEMKAESKESSPPLFSLEKTLEGEFTSFLAVRVLANCPRLASSELDNPPANFQAIWGHADPPCCPRGRAEGAN